MTIELRHPKGGGSRGVATKKEGSIKLLDGGWFSGGYPMAVISEGENPNVTTSKRMNYYF